MKKAYNIGEVDRTLDDHWGQLVSIHNLERVQQVLLSELDCFLDSSYQAPIQDAISLATALIEVHEDNIKELSSHD